jgi:hypothetical protein
MPTLKEKVKMTKLAEMTISTIASIVGSLVTIVACLYGIFLFYYQAQESHAITTAHMTTIRVLEDSLKESNQHVSSLESQLNTLTELYNKEREIKEFYSMRDRLSDLKDWERNRYCELYKTLKRGDECDAP